ICRINFTGDNIPLLRNFIFPFKSLKYLEDFDLVHTQYHPGIFAGNVSAKLHGKPHIFTFHGFAPIRPWRNYRQKLKMIDHRIGTFFALRFHVDKIITVSNYLKRELITKYFVDKDKIHVIYNGVDTERFNPKVDGNRVRKIYRLGETPVVLYLGRLAPYKGVHFLIKAIPHVLKELPEAKFVIGGAARYDAPNIWNLTQKLGVQQSIVFTGYVPNDAVPELYACCDVFCYPSLWEGFGLTPAEAQASGKPVVAFNTCALPEVVVHKHTGLLVEPCNVKALAESIVFLLKDPKLRRRMGAEARKRILKMFSWEKAAEETLKIYNEVLQ
ncbi:glycosyltransferase family 4 protein, partial [Candidatus Bathyarchaeota archaeon]|nr:glycosyltransferase family 4 protein [Candidatus Bathyarchaeota archaeon]